MCGGAAQNSIGDGPPTVKLFEAHDMEDLVTCRKMSQDKHFLL